MAQSIGCKMGSAASVNHPSQIALTMTTALGAFVDYYAVNATADSGCLVTMPEESRVL